MSWNRNAGPSRWPRRSCIACCRKAAARLRALGYLAGGLAVSVKFMGNERWGDEMSFLETQDTLDFIRVFGLLWQRCPPSRRLRWRWG